MRKIINFLRKLITENVDVLIMPRLGKPLKFKMHMGTFVVGVLGSGALLVIGVLGTLRLYDYWIIRADNRLMHLKIQLIADELERGRKTIEQMQTTDKQMRQMLGMSSGKLINLPKDWEQTKEKQDKFAQRLASEDLKNLSEEEFGEYIDSIESSSELQLASFKEIAWYFANHRDRLNYTPSIRPSTARISSEFGYRVDPVSKRISRRHNGIDFAGKPDSPIVATADGVVRHAGWVSGYGQAVLVDHGFGYSTLYAHTTGLRVKEGDVVKRGDKIATMGSSGRSTGTHLHYEVWKDGQAVNPRKFFK